jgi:hypothetical protein
MKETTTKGGILSPRDTNGYFFRSQSGEQQWVCRLCGKRRTYDQLKSHMDSAHFVSLNVLTKDFEFVKSLYRLVAEASGG